MKIIDKRKNDHTLSEFRLLPAGSVFELEDSSIVALKLPGDRMSVTFGVGTTSVINALALYSKMEISEDKYVYIEPCADKYVYIKPCTMVRALNTELVIHSNKIYVEEK